MGDSSEAEFAPLCVPLALRPARSGQRVAASQWVRLATGISGSAVRLRSALPEELHGTPLRLHLTLPAPLPYMPDADSDGDGGWQGELSLLAVPKEVVVRDEQGERAELRQLTLSNLSKAQRELIERYVSLRLLSDE